MILIVVVFTWSFLPAISVPAFDGGNKTEHKKSRTGDEPPDHVKLNESIKNGVPALPRQGEVNKPQEDVMGDEPIRPDKVASHAKPLKKKITLRVTRYYKPEKKQKHYATGSYRGDIKLNGAGKITASGCKPGIFVIATDPNVLPPGSVICRAFRYYVAGDRGGAIRRNRADFFTGKGDKGLKKALNPKNKKTLLTFKIVYLAKN